MYSFNFNRILVCPLKNRKRNEIISKLEEICNYLENYRFKYQHQILDNKVSNEMNYYLKDKEVKF